MAPRAAAKTAAAKMAETAVSKAPAKTAPKRKTAAAAATATTTAAAPAGKKRKANDVLEEAEHRSQNGDAPKTKRSRTAAKAVKDEDEPAATATVKKPTARATKTAAAKRAAAAAEAEKDEDEDEADDTPPAATTAKSTAAKKKAAAAAAKEPAKKAPAAKKASPKKGAAAAPKPTAAMRAAAAKEAAAAKAAAADVDMTGAEESAKENAAPPVKKRGPRKPRAPRPVAIARAALTFDLGPKINKPPTEVLDVYVFGEGSAGELGLGSKSSDGKRVIDVKHPRLNKNLSASTVQVVQVSTGGMHAIALTADNRLLTWGVNDQGALGRDTQWEDDAKAADGPASNSGSAEDSDDDGETGLNPKESTPGEVSNEHFSNGTRFAQVCASDSASFVLTEDGRVYGWGTFRSSDGILGFSQDVKVQERPTLVPSLKSIKALAAGSNHVMALDNKGVVVAWGCGQQNQLGRRIIERCKYTSLTPKGLGLPKNRIIQIACGSYHSFAIERTGAVWAWGLNNFGETGIRDKAGEDDAVILRPTIVQSLKNFHISNVAGGEHHSVACTDDGRVLAWGRADGSQVGVAKDKFTPDNTMFDDKGQARILLEPQVLPEVTDAVSVSAGVDNSFAITRSGKAYAWGFSENYQTGLGSTDDVEVPTLVENSAVKGKTIVYAGCGGQFSILAGPFSAPAPETNGHVVNGDSHGGASGHSK